MKTSKVTVTLANEIPGQPPFVIVMLLEQLNDYSFRATFPHPISERFKIEYFTMSMDRHVHFVFDNWNSLLPDDVDLGEWVQVLALEIRDNVTGKSRNFQFLWDTCQVEPYVPDEPLLDQSPHLQALLT